MRGEQRTPGTDQAVHQRALGCAGRDGVDPAQQQRMVCQQQAVVGDFVDDRRRGVDRDGHRVQRIVGVTAHQADRIPRLGKPRRIGLVQHLDDVGQPHTHRRFPLSSAIASASSGHSGRTAARR